MIGSRRGGAGVVAAVLAGVVSVCAPICAVHAQSGVATASVMDTTDPMMRAMVAEDKGHDVAATVAYREALLQTLRTGRNDGDRISLSLLGLERTWAQLGVRDSILPVVMRVLQVRPTDPVARSIQLRTLVALGKYEDANAAFVSWRRVAGSDGAPFREYSRLLIEAGRAQTADSVLQDAAKLLGNGGALAGEVAQLHVALERWNSAAVAFREALIDQPYLEMSAQYALTRAPASARDSIRAVLSAPPVLLPPRRLLASLELYWGEPRRAWVALSSVQADDSTAAAWREFGERAEMAQAWQVARDVWLAVFDRRGDLESQTRAAQNALSGGDAAGALSIAQRAAGPVPTGDGKAASPTQRIQALLPIEVAALGELGRAEDAQKLLTKNAGFLDPTAKAIIAESLVGAWLRSGDVERARAAVQGSDLVNDDETMGWMALYDGDLAAARKRLVRADTKRPELVDAIGMLARVRGDTSVGLGQAFLLLARQDSMGAAKKFTALADSVEDAAPALLSFAARLELARAGSKQSLFLWDRIIKDFPKSPEAPEALLNSARALRDAGDKAGAITRYESLLIDYPESALVHQGRRELEQLKGTDL